MAIPVPDRAPVPYTASDVSLSDLDTDSEDARLEVAQLQRHLAYILLMALSMGAKQLGIFFSKYGNVRRRAHSTH